MTAESAKAWSEAKEELERTLADLTRATEAHTSAKQAERAAWAVLEGLANGIKPPQRWDRPPHPEAVG